MFNNWCGYNGGAIFNWSSSPVLTNVTIYGNFASGGGGIHFYSTSNPVVNNCILWGNYSRYGRGNQIYIEGSTPRLVVNYSCYSNGTSDVTGSSSINFTNHNITSNPQFINVATKDFRINGVSPCADAGLNSYNSQSFDVRGAGFDRKLSKIDGSAGTIDMGAYEYKFGVDPTVCINPSDGGMIAGTQNVCTGSAPTELSSMILPYGQSGTLIYKWQFSTTGSGSGFTDITPAATSASYTPGALNVSTWFKRLSKVSCNSDWTGALESNVIKVTVNSSLPVSVSIAASVNPICTGTSVTFTATPTNGGTPTYQWKLNGTNIGNGTDTYTSTTLANNDVVTCVLTSSATCATGNPATSNAITMVVVNSYQWTGAISTNWGTPGNWSPAYVPDALSNVIITHVTNQPVVNEAPATPAICNDITLENEAILSIAPGKALTVNGTITNNAGTTGLVILSNASGTGSLLHNTNSVPATFTHYMGADTWNLISSPFEQGSGAVSASLSPSTADTAWLRPYNDGIGWGNYILPLTYQFIPLQGYAAWLTNQTTVQMTGLFLNGTMNKSLVYNATNGWNFTGNPYPSAIDWDLVDRVGTSASMYLWDNSYAGQNNGNYNTYNSMSQIGVPSSTTNIIPPFQGFFVEALDAVASLNFSNNARLHSNQPFYKDLNSASQVLVRMKITDPQNRFDEFAVCTNPNANNEFDSYDSRKMSAGSDAPEIFTMAQNEELIINAIQTVPIVIPVNIKTSQAGNFVLNAFEMNSDANTRIQLEDTQMGTTTDLRSNAVNTVSLQQGNNNNRFFLRFGSTTGINEVENTSLSTIVRDGQLYVYTSGNEAITQVDLYNMTGQMIASQHCGTAGCLVNAVKVSKGVYIVKALVGKSMLTKKVIIY